MSFKKIKTDSAIVLAKLFVWLPRPIILIVGRLIGRIVFLSSSRRKKIAHKNIQLCFPELDAIEQEQLVKNNLISTGQGLTESLLAYWANDSKCSKNTVINGLEYVKIALQGGKGCLLLSYHHHLIELACRVININLETKSHMLVRQHNNKFLEKHIDQARRSHCDKTIDKKDMKSVMKSLKNNSPVFYVPDQNFSYQFEYIDFFKQPAATVLAAARIAQITQSPVIPWSAYRGKSGKYVIEFHEPLKYFNDKNTSKTLEKMNSWFELKIRKNPEQYLWVHRRFKNHPKGKNFIYNEI